MRLKDRTALVTGSTSGIGEAVAEALAREGAHVVVSGRDRDRGERVVAAIRAAGGRADFIAADLHDAASALALGEEATDVLGGRIDILVNNAGTTRTPSATGAVSESDFDRLYALNVKAPFFLTGVIGEAMARRGTGAVINIGSTVAKFGFAGSALYGSTKAALEKLTQDWAAEYGPRGVRVNSVSPGPTHTPLTARIGDRDTLKAMTDGTPANRPAEPSEVADAVVFLASDEARYIHGARLPLDGGRSAV
ncbi:MULTISPECIES: SDR family NAD(P)-dependent oxidoreductase [unclassified Streptomyces]|uniref:SDR family NAD(P)-dependent oxidoreductase n=1 Tax=unclassified Streptomyces TaxID=2593676 RepID=UPI00101D850E|nr:SDR family oxidoreductase [Streptomyces sp. L-9-10]RYJ29183.1 short-chain alcohol dehydrogenase [Streptomyces sp. L-9-10]